ARHTRGSWKTRRLHGLPCSTVSAEGASHDEPWEFASRPTPAIEDAHHPADIARRLRLARRIWDAASNARGTPVENYIAGRGIALPAAPSLRWAAHCWHDAIRTFLPAMVGGVRDVDG